MKKTRYAVAALLLAVLMLCPFGFKNVTGEDNEPGEQETGAEETLVREIEFALDETDPSGTDGQKTELTPEETEATKQQEETAEPQDTVTVADFCPAVVTYDEVENLLKTILSQTEGKYWNRYRGKYNGKANAQSQEMLKLAAKTGDYASVCTDTRCTCSPKHDENGCQSNIIEGCRQCQGFAKWIGYCLTGECPSGNVSTAHWERMTSVSRDFVFKPGDVVHKTSRSRHGHYMVVVGPSAENPDSLVLMDCNSDGGCLIASHEYTYTKVLGWVCESGGFVCRYDGFTDHRHVADENGDCVWVDCDRHCHNFNELGYCTKYTCDKDYLYTWEFSRNERTGLKGYAIPNNLKNGRGAYLARVRPYTDTAVTEFVIVTGTEEELTGDIANAEVTGYCYNHRGELWYELTRNGQKCYVSSEIITVRWVTATDETAG